MDIITGVLSLILAVVCGIVVYFISVSSMKEKTYDEVKAEHKKKAEEYLAPGRSAKDKAKDKKVKKAVKKSKENHKTVPLGKTDEALKESDNGEHHVQQITKDRSQEELKEKVIESSQQLTKQSDNQSNLIASKVNTIVEHPPKSSKAPQKPTDKPVKTLKGTQQEEPPIHPTKSDQKPKVQSNNIQENQVKLKVSDKVTEVKPHKNVDKVVDNQPQEPTVKEVSKTNVKPLSSSAGHALSPAKISRKKRNDISTLHQINGDKECVDAAVLTALVRKSEMTGAEIQTLIECLLNKQLGAANLDNADWTEGRQDPVVRLKKQLAEKERAVAEEQEAAAALQSKLRDLRNELNAARASARQHEEAGARLQQAVEEKQALVQQIQQLQRKLADEHRLLCQTQADQEQQMQHELLAQRQQLEMHITRLTEQHQEEVRTELERLMGKLQFETGRLQEQLSAKRAEAEQLAAMVQALQADNARLTAQISSACVEAQQLRDENETLSAQAQVAMERPATEGMEHNGEDDDGPADKIMDSDVLIEKLREDLDSHEKELTRCKSELSQRESLVSELKRDLDKAHANTESLRKEWKYTMREQESTVIGLREEKECAQKLVGSLREEVGKSEMEIARLRSQLEGRDGLVEALKSELNTHKTRIADQAVTIEALRAETQSDDLRRVVDGHRLEMADRESKITTLTSQVAGYKADVARLQGALDASKEASVRFDVELKQLAEKHSTVCQELEKLKSEKNESDESGSSLDDLLEQNGQLQSLVAHYKAIIGDTEAMLNRLQSHVEHEETRWRREMCALRAQLSAQQDASDSP